MKSYKILHGFNIFLFVTTLILYLTIIYGLLFQIVLGAMQIIFAIFLFTQFKHISAEAQKHLKIYGSMVLVYFAVLFAVSASSDPGYGFGYEGAFIIGYIVIIPLSLAAYFLYITGKIKKEGEDGLKGIQTNDELLDQID